MAYFLDTLTLLRALTEPEHLEPRARPKIADVQETLLVSSACAWEITTKARLGRLPGADALVAGYRAHLDHLGVKRLPIAEDHALLVDNRDWPPSGPF